MRRTTRRWLWALAITAACSDPQAPNPNTDALLSPQYSAAPTQVASGGGNVDGGFRGGPEDHFQVHIHSFAFRLLNKGSGWDFDLTYHDHHEGAATTPIHQEPDAFSLRLEKPARVIVGTAVNGARYVFVEGPATQRMAGRPHLESKVWACMWAEDGDGAGSADRFHLETAEPPFGNNYTSGGGQVFLAPVGPPPPPPAPLAPRACRGPNNPAFAPLTYPEAGYTLTAGNVTVR